MRPMHISYDRTSQNLFASTNRGTILKFDAHLSRLATSAPVYDLNNLYVMVIDNTYVYARDISGKLARWRKDTLELDTVVDLTAWSRPDEADVPNVSHGLFIRQGTVYVSMPQGRVGKFRQVDLGFVGLSDFLPKALIECVEYTGPQGHFAVDFSGHLYHGDVDGNMEPVSRVANGACHQIIYDNNYDRYWITDDFHCGLALFKAENPRGFFRLPLTNDDVEWMSFNSDQTELLVACFDRYIYHVRNEAVPKVIGKIGPLKYQINHVEWVEPTLAFALTESGEIYQIDPTTGHLKKGDTGTNAVWDIQPAFGEAGLFWVAYEDGFVRQVNVQNWEINTVKERDLKLGMIRRVIPTPDHGVLVLSTRGHVAKFDRNFEPVWMHEGRPLLRDFALNGDRLIYCSEVGDLVCLSAATGTVVWRRDLQRPLWTVTVDPGGMEYFIASRLCDRGDQGRESSSTPTTLVAGDLKTGRELRQISIFGNIKRMKWTTEGNILMNGNGEVATTVMRPNDFSIQARWSEWQLNTCEASLISNRRLYTTTYGYQLNTFDLSGPILESAFPFEDYATSLVKVNDDTMLAGGRGAFLSLFRLQEGLPKLVMTRRY